MNVFAKLKKYNAERRAVRDVGPDRRRGRDAEEEDEDRRH